APTNSSGSAMRASGALMLLRCSDGQCFDASVSNAPGKIAFTRTFGANASARPTVSAFKPALAHVYGSSRHDGMSEPTVPTLVIEPPSPSYIRVPTRAPSRKGPLRVTPCTLS